MAKFDITLTLTDNEILQAVMNYYNSQPEYSDYNVTHGEIHFKRKFPSDIIEIEKAVLTLTRKEK